jgi:membrane-associated phospholipid phosphatase
MNFNIRLFFKINKLVGKSRFWDAFGRAGAEWVIFAMIAWFITVVCLVYLPDRTSILICVGFLGVAIVTSWVVNKIIGLIVKQSRPYVVYPETKVLLDPRPLFSNKTFPSDHATIAFLIFFIALLLRLPPAYPHGQW